MRSSDHAQPSPMKSTGAKMKTMLSPNPVFGSGFTMNNLAGDSIFNTEQAEDRLLE